MASRGPGSGPKRSAYLRAIVLASAAFVILSGEPEAGPLSTSRSAGSSTSPSLEASVLVRTGDVAPVQARTGDPFFIARLPGGGLVFGSDDGTIMLREPSGRTRILLHGGDAIPGCGTVSA